MNEPLTAVDRRWLPRGHHWDLHIEHFPQIGAGTFTGGGWKLCWHITVSPWMSVDAMVSTVVAKRAEPHFVIGGRKGTEHPVVVQLLPLDEAGRSLRHTFPPQTNRANVIQVEICATPETVKGWTDWTYKALGNLAGLIEHRVPIPTRCPRSFTNTKRFTPTGYVRVKGHHGHMHVPGNDHWDPSTAFKGETLCKFIRSAPNEL